MHLSDLDSQVYWTYCVLYLTHNLLVMTCFSGPVEYTNTVHCSILKGKHWEGNDLNTAPLL